MNITWINDTATTGIFRGSYITLRGARTPAGTVRLTIYFSREAVSDLELVAGERLMVGLDEERQLLAFKKTLCGGTAIKGRDTLKHRNTLVCAVTIPIFNLPKPQGVSAEETKQNEDATTIPFSFNASDFTGWKKARELKAVA